VASPVPVPTCPEDCDNFYRVKYEIDGERWVAGVGANDCLQTPFTPADGGCAGLVVTPDSTSPDQVLNVCSVDVPGLENCVITAAANKAGTECTTDAIYDEGRCAEIASGGQAISHFEMYICCDVPIEECIITE